MESPYPFQIYKEGRDWMIFSEVGTAAVGPKADSWPSCQQKKGKKYAKPVSLKKKQVKPMGKPLTPPESIKTPAASNKLVPPPGSTKTSTNATEAPKTPPGP